MGVIVVTGIPGVGKTTVMKKAAEGMDIQFITFGTVMIEIAKEMNLVKNRDEMRKLTLDQQKELQIKTAVEVLKTITETIRELGKIPNGELYARLMPYLSYNDYTKAIQIIKNAGLVIEINNILVWNIPTKHTA